MAHLARETGPTLLCNRAVCPLQGLIDSEAGAPPAGNVTVTLTNQCKMVGIAMRGAAALACVCPVVDHR